jgi:hypothetical protein
MAASPANAWVRETVLPLSAEGGEVESIRRKRRVN